MACTDNIVKNIVSDCTTAKNGGMEVKVWIFPRQTYKNAITYDNTLGNKITSIASVQGAKAYVATGVKKLFNAGHDLVSAEDRPDKYTHFFSFQQFEIAAADIANVDSLNDVFIVFERKDKASDGDGTFVALGVKNGLYKSSDTRRVNDVNGARVIEMTSMAGEEENVSEYTVLSTDYATTKSMLVALETAGV
jgi:hypothetical protein